MKSSLKTILFGILFGLAGYYWALKLYLVDNKESLHHYEKLSKEGKNTIAILDSVYLETTIKIAGTEGKSYSSSYFFKANGRRYKGTYKFEDPKALDQPFIVVKYLPQDPAVNTYEIDKKLKEAREEAESKTSLWIGVIMIFISILTVFSGFKKLIRRNSVNEETVNAGLVKEEPVSADVLN